MYKYLFGPVPSRRLGMSLGVDLVPAKVCSLDCVYCEVGKTTKLTTQRMEYIPYEKIVEELTRYFDHAEDPDYFTFSGAGEPTLNSRIGDVIHFVKKKKPAIPVAVLTNGTLFNDKAVRAELMEADVVLPSLDAATGETFNAINRPATSLDITTIIQGLADFRKEFKGKIWLEVFILPGYNDMAAELELLRKGIMKIAPDAVQLNTLDRPGTETELESAPLAQLRSIVTNWDMDNIEIIARPKTRKALRSYHSDKENTILTTIKRRPCTAGDLSAILGIHINEINKYLDVMEAENKIKPVHQQRGVFYQIA